MSITIVHGCVVDDALEVKVNLIQRVVLLAFDLLIDSGYVHTLSSRDAAPSSLSQFQGSTLSDEVLHLVLDVLELFSGNGTSVER